MILAYIMNITVNVLKFQTPKSLTKWHMQTVQTQISSLIWVYTACHSTKYFQQQVHDKQNLGQTSMEYSVQNFRTFTVSLYK